MKKLGKYVYNIFFWISRIFSISVFGICLSVILHAKYVLAENYSIIIMPYIIDFADNCFDEKIKNFGWEKSWQPK